MSSIGENRYTFFDPICNKCKNHLGGIKCKAFDSIPDEILNGENDHSKPCCGQKNDIVFEPIDEYNAGD